MGGSSRSGGVFAHGGRVANIAATYTPRYLSGRRQGTPYVVWPCRIDEHAIRRSWRVVGPVVAIYCFAHIISPHHAYPVTHVLVDTNKGVDDTRDPGDYCSPCQ